VQCMYAEFIYLSSQTVGWQGLQAACSAQHRDTHCC